MTDVQGSTAAKVFISYRRDDSAPYAGRLYDRLADAIGQQNIFMDVDSISFGLDFAEAIQGAVSSCDVLLAIIGPEWLTVEHKGRRRLDDPDDFVRLEIEAALERNVRVVPVLVDEAELPQRDELPESLRPLVRRQTLRLSHDQFRLESQRLIDDIVRLSPGSSATAPAAGTPAPPGVAPVSEPAPGAVTAQPVTAQPVAAQPVAAQPVAGAPAVTVVVGEANHLTLAVQLKAPHVIDVDNSGFFGLVKVDGEQIVKKVNPEGTHAFVLDDAGVPVTGSVSFGTTWTANLKNVVLRIGDQVVYES